VVLSPPWRSVRDDAVAPTAPKHGADGLAARKPERVIGPSRLREEHVHVLVQANQARSTSAQTNATWREGEATLNDDIRRRHDSPKPLHASAGWRKKFRGVMVQITPLELTGAEATRLLADLAARRQVLAAAPQPAFNALRWLFRQVFTPELGERSEMPRAKRRKYLPPGRSRQEMAWRVPEWHEPSA
jgi:hypothetical protein